MNLSKEVKVGFLVTMTLVTCYLGFNFLKGKEIFPTTRTYYALYENAKGLNTANEVMLNGFKVGRIQNLKILPENNYKILVELVIDKHVKLTDQSIARLENTSLLGNKTIELIIKEGKPLEGYDTLLTEMEQDLQTRFAESTLPALDDARSITLLTNQFVQNLVENTDRINTIFSNLEKTSQELRKAVNTNKKNLATISRNIADISSALSDKEIGIRPVLTQLKEITHEIESMRLSELANRFNRILVMVEEGPVYGHMDQTLINLDRLLVDLRTHPGKYIHFSIFGRDSIFSRGRNK